MALAQCLILISFVALFSSVACLAWKPIAVSQKSTLSPLSTEVKCDGIVQTCARSLLLRLRGGDELSASKAQAQAQAQEIGVGIGISKSGRTGHVVRRLAPGFPAAESGQIFLQDTIFAIGGVQVDGLSSNDVMQMLRGPVGTVVELQLKRSGQSSLVMVSLTRKPAKTSPVRSPLQPQKGVQKEHLDNDRHAENQTQQEKVEKHEQHVLEEEQHLQLPDQHAEDQAHQEQEDEQQQLFQHEQHLQSPPPDQHVEDQAQQEQAEGLHQQVQKQHHLMQPPLHLQQPHGAVGIGLAVEAGGRVLIARLLPEGAAAISGSLQVGDILVSVQGKSVAALSKSEVASRIRSAAAKHATLYFEILRSGLMLSVGVPLDTQPEGAGHRPAGHRAPERDTPPCERGGELGGVEERRSAHGGGREESIPVGTADSSWMTAVKKMTGALVSGFGTDLPDARKLRAAGEALSVLQGMGYAHDTSSRALQATGNSVEGAIQWISLQELVPGDASSLSTAEAAAFEERGGCVIRGDSSNPVEQLMTLGFDRPQVEKALRNTQGRVMMAADWLFEHQAKQQAKERRRRGGGGGLWSFFG